MPLVSNDLAYLEQRVRELKAKIKLRQSQADLPTSEGVYKDSSIFVTALYKELNSAAAQVVALKYDPVQVIDRMEQKRMEYKS